MKVGIGYDIHRTCEYGEGYILGGVHVPTRRGLVGHSDADVLTHAIINSILGALCLGDIGRHFPPSDPAYKGISSLELLRRTAEMMRQQGYRVSNLDSNLIIQSPKIAPYITEMRQNLAAVLACTADSVSIKANTSEWLDAVGSNNGVAAQAVVVLVNENT